MRKNKVHNESAKPARDTVKASTNDVDDDAAAVIQKSWRRHKERQRKHISKVVHDKKRQPLVFPKTFSILSFDGGGAMGILQLFILKDVMNLATIMLRKAPEAEASKWWTDFKFREAVLPDGKFCNIV